MHRTLASLWRRLISASMGSRQSTARTPGHLVGGDAHAEAGAADQDAAVGLALGHRLGDGDGEVRVVGGPVPGGDAEVADLVPELLQRSRPAAA